MWEVPQTSLESRGLPDLVTELRERHGLEVPGAARARATPSRSGASAEVRVRLASQPPADPERYAWARPAEIGALPVSSLTRKVVRALQAPQLPLQLE